MIVVDTNILAYFLIESDRTEVCRNLMRTTSEWSAPFLWRSEFRNVLTQHIRHAGMTHAGAVARMQQAEALLKGREHSIASHVVLERTARYPVSAYDAEFICLADELGTHLVTADNPLIKQFPTIAITPEHYLRSHNA